jgi:hypothetical protein
VLSIWAMPPWLIAIAVLALLLPGYLAGMILRGRDRTASPARVATVTIPVTLAMLFLAVVGLPAAEVTQSGIGDGLAQDVRFSFDLLQSAVVGGVAAAIAALAGFRTGGRPWRILVRVVPALRPKAPPPMVFR